MPVDSRRRKLKPTDIPSISADPYLTAGDVFKKNIEFLTGLKDWNIKKVTNPPIFRLGIILSGDPQDIVKTKLYKLSDNPQFINNYAPDYVHILPSDKTANDTNFLVCFIDLTFKFEGNGDSLEQSLVPIWLGNSIERTNGAVSTMKTFRIFNNGVYGFENEHFWKEFDADYAHLIHGDDTQKKKKETRKVYTIWFENEHYGIKALEWLFEPQPQFKSRLDAVKKIFLTNQQIDLYQLYNSTHLKKIPTANEFQLIETAMNLQSGVMDHSEEGKQNTQLVRPEFRRIDSFIFYVTYAFLHILDDILERTRLQESNFLIEESFNIDTLASAEESE